MKLNSALRSASFLATCQQDHRSSKFAPRDKPF
jgi:hypothetical protein